MLTEKTGFCAWNNHGSSTKISIQLQNCNVYLWFHIDFTHLQITPVSQHHSNLKESHKNRLDENFPENETQKKQALQHRFKTPFLKIN